MYVENLIQNNENTKRSELAYYYFRSLYVHSRAICKHTTDSTFFHIFYKIDTQHKTKQYQIPNVCRRLGSLRVSHSKYLYKKINVLQNF